MISDLLLQATLYVTHRKQLYVNMMRGAKAFATARELAPIEVVKDWVPTDEQAADVCGNCHQLFGTVTGGRLRARCCYCRDYRNTISHYEIQELANIWQCSQEYVIFLLASAIEDKSYHVTPQSPAPVSLVAEHNPQLPA